VKLRRALRAALLTLLVLFGAMQFIRRPDFVNPAILPAGQLQAHVQVPAGIDSILRRACYDCHSHETRWPLYARVAPASWLVARDVRMGRADLNFSAWSTDPVREPTPRQRLGGICSDLRKGIMPPRSYLLLHRQARVLPSEVERICRWTSEARERITAPPPE
jgi:hypothetical protein